MTVLRIESIIDPTIGNARQKSQLSKIGCDDRYSPTVHDGKAQRSAGYESGPTWYHVRDRRTVMSPMKRCVCCSNNHETKRKKFVNICVMEGGERDVPGFHSPYFACADTLNRIQVYIEKDPSRA